MQAHLRPTVSEEIVPINDDLDIHYGLFKNGFTFTRGANSWRLWPKLEFVAPQHNPWISAMCETGVAWTLCEHVSIAVHGWAEYVFEGLDGPIRQIWTPGCHNVEHGGGYLPAGSFTRTFHDDFTLCCLVQKLQRRPGIRYHFEVVKGTAVLDRDALFVHHATGPLQKQTNFDVPAGHVFEADTDSITIIGRVR